MTFGCRQPLWRHLRFDVMGGTHFNNSLLSAAADVIKQCRRRKLAEYRPLPYFITTDEMADKSRLYVIIFRCAGK